MATTQPLTRQFVPPPGPPEESASLVPLVQPLAMQRAPQIVLEEAAKAAHALRDVIEKKPSKVVINGKTYLTFEDWQTLGRFYGVTAAARSTTYIEYGRVRGFESHAQAVLVSTDQVISDAQAMCLDDESKWQDKPLYQLRSMAQTRACAKVLRNVLAWVVVLAGYQPTPAEELVPTYGELAQSSVPPAPAQSIHLSQSCAALANAANEDQLRSLFRKFYSEASAARDRHAQGALIQAKDARLRELR